MNSSDKTGLIISTILGLLIIVMSLVLLTGRGAFLIAGYNTASKEEKEKYDEKALCRFIGKILLPIGILTPMLAVSNIYEIGWFPAVYGIAIFAISIFAVIYANTGNRFKR